MAENIVGGLFGVQPEQLIRQRQATDTANAFRFAQLSPMERAQMAIYQGGAGIGRGISGLLGGDPEMERVSQIKQLSSQFDLTTPQGARQFAQALQPFAPNEAIQAVRMADQMEQAGLGRQKTIAETTLAEARTQQAEAGRLIQVDLGDRIQLVNGLTQEVVREIPKGLTPQQAAKARSGVASEDGIGQPGPVGKGGAYRDITGQILGPSEMKTVRQEFEGAQKLLDTLNQVKEDDVRNAQSLIDWTTKGETKALASKKTLMAQTKIAASQLMEQINQLPPGSASDADMRASMKSFPGYSDADALAAWVNETKRKLQATINSGQDRFGFKARVQATDPINLKKPKQPAAPKTSGGWSIVQ
jgi:hypothetical protein